MPGLVRSHDASCGAAAVFVSEAAALDLAGAGCAPPHPAAAATRPASPTHTPPHESLFIAHTSRPAGPGLDETTSKRFWWPARSPMFPLTLLRAIAFLAQSGVGSRQLAVGIRLG